MNDVVFFSLAIAVLIARSVFHSWLAKPPEHSSWITTVGGMVFVAGAFTTSLWVTVIGCVLALVGELRMAGFL